jgi:hypothetical protein
MQTHGATVGRWTAMTAFTPIRPFWAVWLRKAFWPLFGIAPGVLNGLVEMSMIGCARWSLLGGRPRTYLPFESNFNGAGPEYLEAFALVVPWGVRGSWSGAIGVPDPSRVGAFQRYARDHNFEPSWYYCAYPDATTKTIRSALELSRRLTEFRARTARLDDERFRDEYLAFLARAIRIRNPTRTPARRTGMVSVLLPVREGAEEALRLDLELLFDEPLPVPEDRTHFARFTIVQKPGPYLVVAGWFDGAEEDWLRELRDRLGARAGAIWRHCLYEGDDPLAHRMAVGAPFLGYDGATLPEIHSALDEAERFRALALRAQDLTAAELRGGWRAL